MEMGPDGDYATRVHARYLMAANEDRLRVLRRRLRGLHWKVARDVVLALVFLAAAMACVLFAVRA